LDIAFTLFYIYLLKSTLFNGRAIKEAVLTSRSNNQSWIKCL